MLKSILIGIKKFFFVTGCVMLWFVYAGLTLNKSPRGYEYTGDTGPMPSGYSIFLLGVMFALIWKKRVLSTDISLAGILAKLVVGFVVAFGLYVQLSFDPIPW